MTATTTDVAGGAGGTAGLGWLAFTLLTISMWGLYGIFLHKGQGLMADPVLGRYKAFLWVGVAYMLIAVLAPVGLLVAKGASWSMTSGGITWSILAGTVGAIGAFCVLLAFGAGGTPAKVMTLVFAGAPVVNAVVAITLAGAWGEVRWTLVLGILLAVAGSALVTISK